MRVGFIGLGKMGRPMATHLLEAGFDLVVHNRSRGVVDALAAQGAVPASSPREVGDACDFVFTCLPTPAAVDEVYLGQSGLAEAARPYQVLADHSTVAPETSRKVARALETKGAFFLDAPVSGGPAGARAATLTIMVGGPREAFEKALPLLQAMGKNIHYVGPTGAGSVVKLANQLMVAVNTLGVMEALVLGAKAGVSGATLLEVIGTSFGGSAMLSRHVPLVLRRQFQPATTVNLLAKDLGLIRGLGQELDVRLLLAGLAEQICTEAKALGLGEMDISALVQPLERLACVEVG